MQGFMAVWPTNKIVHVRIEKTEFSHLPFRVVSLEKGVNITPDWEYFSIPDVSFVKLYRSRQSAVRGELEKLHKQYAESRRALRTAQRHYKWALRQVEDYKHFDELQNPFFK